MTTTTGQRPAPTTIGRIERLPLRDVWRHEAADFSTWLQDHLEILSQAIGLPVANAECERPVGSFSVDLVAEDGAGRLVVIENQLERTDHDHLGKLLTYIVNVEAKTAIWITSDPRPEHAAVIAWLNETAPADFYLVKLEAVRIRESVPAPLFTLIAGPSEEARDAGSVKKSLAERHDLRERFWSWFIPSAARRTTLHRDCPATGLNWISARTNRPGMFLNYAIKQHAWRVELYIDRSGGAEENLRSFEFLRERREEIETRFGGPLDWQALEDRRACRVCLEVEGGGWRDEDQWPQVTNDMVDAMVRLDEALKGPFRDIDRAGA